MAENVETQNVNNAVADNIVSDNAAVQSTSNPVQDAKPVESEASANPSTDFNWDFSIPKVESPVQNTESKADSPEPVKDWRSVIKSVDKKEIFKELGIPELDEFDIQFSNYRRQGGDPYKFIEAKTFDENKVPDEQWMKMDLSKQYPNLNNDELNDLFNDRYKQDEFATDEEKRRGMTLLKADAYKSKQNYKKELENIATIPQNQNVTNPNDVIQQIEREQIEYVNQVRQLVLNNDATKNLMANKKVAIPAGKFGSFNLSIDDPNEVVGYLNDANVYNKYNLNEKGELNIQRKLTNAIIDVIGHERYNERLIQYGMQLGKNAILEENQNAIKPQAKIASPKEKIQWRSVGGNA